MTRTPGPHGADHGGTARVAAAVSAVLAASVVLASCGRPADGDWRAEVDSVLTAQAGAWNRGDIAGYMDGYWKSDSLLFTSGGNIRRGWKETLDAYAARYDTPEKMGTLKFSGLEYHLTAPGAAWVFGRWELDRAGDRPAGVFTVVLKKFPAEGWRIVHDHTSSDP